MDKDSLPSSWMEISMKTANKGAASQVAQPIVSKEMKRNPGPFVDTDEEDNQPLSLRKARASTVAKPTARGASSSSTAGAAATEAGLTGSVAGDKRKLFNNHPVSKYKINMETEVTIARQAQKQMRQAALSVSELCTGFETSKMKNEELRKQVNNLEVQIQKWKRQKASWDEKRKELERERDEGREEALKAVGEKHNLELKLEEAVRRAEDALKASKKAMYEAALKAASEKQNLEEKLEKAVKEAEDAKASAKKAIDEAVASTKKCYKIGLGNFVAYLASGEGRSLGDYVNEFVKEMPCHDMPPADGAVDMAGHKGDVAIKVESPCFPQLPLS